MYVLGFDHGVTSAGFLLDHAHPAARALLAAGLPPRELWRRLLARYPSVARQFAGARAARPIALARRVQRRAARAAGPRWLLLPGAYCAHDALFSTGIAWSLLGVERLGALFAPGGLPDAAALAAYDDLLAAEADHLARLVQGAYLARADWRLFVPFSLLYFAAASFGEAARRLRSEGPRGAAGSGWTWEGFLGARDPVLAPAVARGVERLGALLAGGRRPSAAEAARFAAWAAAAMAPRNVAGLGDPARGDLYPVDFEPLVAGAHLLGMTPDAVRAALPRLRG
jgi:FADH2 O2-dependent halogenase